MARTPIVGSILGTAIGDALGLPYEGLSRRRAAQLFGPPNRHRFLFGRGMISDDTEHTCMVAQSLVASGGDLNVFQRQLSWRFRLWLLGLPAGTGLATLRSILRLWVGFRPDRSGVFSAGTAPAIRAPIIGAATDDPEFLRKLVRASTRITHTDPKAECGALAVALASQMARQNETVSCGAYLDELMAYLDRDGDELIRFMREAVNSAEVGQSTIVFADSIGLTNAVSAYIYHSVPVAIHAWLSNQGDFRSAVTSVIGCGGETDSTAAIVGGIMGASVGKEGIPREWIDSLWEWPRSVEWMERLAAQLECTIGSGGPVRPISLPFYGVLFRNLFFLMVLLSHGFRRLLPPY